MIQISDSQKWLVLALFALFFWLLYLLGPVLTPFLTAAILAYLGDPLADRLEAMKLSRTASVSIVFFALFAGIILVFLLLIPLIVDQIQVLVSRLPGDMEFFKSRLVAWLDIDLEALHFEDFKNSIVDHWREAGNVLSHVWNLISSSGMAMATFAANVVLIPVVFFYLLRDWDIFMARIYELLPRKQAPIIKRLAHDSDLVLGAFLRGQFMVMIGLTTIYSIGLLIVGLDLAILVGVIAGVVSFVPYLGAIIGIGLGMGAMYFQAHEVVALIPVALVFGVGQLIESFIFTPLFVGDKIGLHPVAVIFAVMAGGQLFGFLGVLLALPVAAVLVVLLRYAHLRYVNSDFYSHVE